MKQLEADKIEVRDIRNVHFLWMAKTALKYVSRHSGPSGAVVYAWLCYYANTKSQDSWPSISMLETDTGLGRMTIIRSLKKLSDIRAIETKRISGARNIYSLLEIQEELFAEAVPKRHRYQNGTSTNVIGCTSTKNDTAYIEQDDKSNKMRGTRARPKNVEEVKVYCLERKNNIDPQLFYDNYEANGWVQGNRGKPVRDWRACVRTWEQREKSQAAPAGGNGRIDYQKYEAMAEKMLGKIATDPMVKNVMNNTPAKAWWVVDRFLKKRYPQGDRGQFSRIEAQLVQESTGART